MSRHLLHCIIRLMHTTNNKYMSPFVVVRCSLYGAVVGCRLSVADADAIPIQWILIPLCFFFRKIRNYVFNFQLWHIHGIQHTAQHSTPEPSTASAHVCNLLLCRIAVDSLLYIIIVTAADSQIIHFSSSPISFVFRILLSCSQCNAQYTILNANPFPLISFWNKTKQKKIMMTEFTLYNLDFGDSGQTILLNSL